MAAVPLAHIATPLAIPSMASVVRKDGMPIRVVSTPLKMPTASPVARPAHTPTKGPAASMAIAVVTVASPATAPIDRSISPAASTKVMATAITAIMAVWRMMLSRLFGSRKPLSNNAKEKITKMATKPR